MFYFDDAKTAFDDPSYLAVLRRAQLRNWLFVQPELTRFRGRVLGCHSPDTISELSAIYEYIRKRYRAARTGSYAWGHGSGAYLSLLWARTNPWFWESVVSWGPVHDLSTWFAHQLESASAEEKAALTTCWGSDPDSTEVQERSRRLSPSTNRGGTQKVRHYVLAPTAPPNAPDGWMAPEAVQVYNWLLRGTNNYMKILEITEEPELASVLKGKGSSARPLGTPEAPVSVAFSVRTENVALLLLHPEQEVDLDFVFSCLDGAVAIP